MRRAIAQLYLSKIDLALAAMASGTSVVFPDSTP